MNQKKKRIPSLFSFLSFFSHIPLAEPSHLPAFLPIYLSIYLSRVQLSCLFSFQELQGSTRARLSFFLFPPHSLSLSLLTLLLKIPLATLLNEA